MKISLQIDFDEEVYLSPVRASEQDNSSTYKLVDENTKEWAELLMSNNSFSIISKDSRIIEDEEDLQVKLNKLFLEVIESEQSGTAITEQDPIQPVDPYDPEKIKVTPKQFNVRLIADMMDEGDIDLTPDFQRNLVWDSIQKSRLIESILLRIPLPMFYFSEDEEGRITVVDGLQRLTTIKEFMDNKFPLKGLEYLKSTCEGKYYSEKNKDGSKNGKTGIDAKYFRWFNQTQFSVNVIDPASPAKVKYDIFRRINTGGKPLNDQEIRNCLASKNLRAILREMSNLPEFKSATDGSIKGVRMEDQEVALRFICFNRFIKEDGDLQNYTGNMNSALDDLTEELGRKSASELQGYVQLYSRAMKNAEYLFGKYAFRKIRLEHLDVGANKQLINKALFVSWSVLLSEYDPSTLRDNHTQGFLAEPLAESIDNDEMLFYYLSYGTNGKSNLQYAFNFAKDLLIEKVIPF
jgi:hypothetical protein